MIGGSQHVRETTPIGPIRSRSRSDQIDPVVQSHLSLLFWVAEFGGGQVGFLDSGVEVRIALEGWGRIESR